MTITMDRRRFLLQSAGGSLAGGLAAARGAPATAPLPADGAAGPIVQSPPVVMAPRADGAEIVWAVARLARGRVEVDAGGKTRVFAGTPDGFAPQGDRVLRVRLDGLKPGTVCRYRTITEAGAPPAAREESPWRTFRTLDPAASATHFAVWNDTHNQAPVLGKLDDLTPEVDVLFWNGDTCNNWDEENWIAPTLLHPGGRDLTARRPLCFVWGNHDVRGRWAFRAPAYVAMPQGRPFHAFRSGPVAFVCLHTGEDKPDDHPSFEGRAAFEPLRREQAAWLRDHVLATPGLCDAPFRVVVCHMPMRMADETGKADYDLFGKRSRDLWHDPLVAWKAQVVVSGHAHQPAWVPASDAFPYAQLIGGGPKPENATWIDGQAGPGGLRLVMRKLDGSVVADQTLQPVR